jgi:hypothetical protein
MAEETTLATARSLDTSDDDEVTKAELQRRMEQARETITQTVTEIKDTVTNQYQSVKESISETLDWREQFRKRPVAWSVGALSVGFVTGYCIAATVKGEGSSRRAGYPSYEESDVWNVGTTPAPAYAAGVSSGAASPASRTYAVAGGAHGSTEYAQQDRAAGKIDYIEGAADEQSDHAVVRAGESATKEEEQPSKPGLMERFKETKAFDRLQDEVAKLGDRFIDQLSTVGQEVVLPALFGKIKELFGVDLSNEQKQGGREAGNRTQAAAAGASSSSSSSAASASRGSQAQGTSDMGGLSYGTSENRAYGTSQDASHDDYGRSTGGGGGTKLSPGPQ